MHMRHDALASACMACDITRQMHEVSVVTAVMCCSSASSANMNAGQCGHDVKVKLALLPMEADDAAEVCILPLADSTRRFACKYRGFAYSSPCRRYSVS